MIETRPQKILLHNGVRLLTFPLAGTETVTALILVNVGSRHEQGKLQGISHFLEHLFFKGTKKRPSPITIAKEIDAVGGYFNAFTSKEYTGFFITCASDKLDLILDILSDILTNSIFDPQELERERGVILEEMRMYFDTPSEYIGEIFERLLYGDSQPLGRDIVGTLESVSGISRKDFLDYITTHYTGQNTVVTLSGKLDDTSIQKAQKFFESFPAGTPGTFDAAKESQSAPQLLIKSKETDQAHIVLGVRTFALHDPRKETLELLSTILGGEKSSRMFVEVREKLGLAYYVYSDATFYADTGHLATHAGVNVTNIDLAISTILKEYKRIMEEPLSDDELRQVKDYVKGRLLIELESSFRMARLVGSRELLEEKTESLKEYFDRLENITAKDIQDLAKAIFKQDQLNLAIIGPFKETNRERFEKLLKL